MATAGDIADGLRCSTLFYDAHAALLLPRLFRHVCLLLPAALPTIAALMAIAHRRNAGGDVRLITSSYAAAP